MLNNVRLVQVVIVLVAITVLVHGISTQESLRTNAQVTNVSPSYGCLGPCASGSSSSSLGGTSSSSNTSSPSTSGAPVLSQPCQAPVSQEHKSRKGRRGQGGFLKSIFKFFMVFIELLLKLFGLDSGKTSTIQPSTTNSTTPSPGLIPSIDTTNTSSSSPCPPISSSSVPTTSSSSSATSSATTDQKLGVCGIPAPAAGSNVALTSADSANPLNITAGGTAGNPKIYDGKCHTVGTITIRASYVTVQNFKIQATGQYGIDSDGTGITIQNNDIKGIHASGDGDLNAITFFGNDTKILYNTAIDFVTGSPGQSHTDAIQTWVSSSHPVASTNVTIQGNKFTGPANPARDANTPSIHQCVMAEGLNQGGNTGGNGNPTNWLIADNYFGDSWNQCIKLDGVNNASVTRNTFAGSSDSVIEIDAASQNVKYYSDNKVTGTYKNGVGTTITQGTGPNKL